MELFISHIFFKENFLDLDFIKKYFDGIELRGERLIKDYETFDFSKFQKKNIGTIVHSTFENIDISSPNEWERTKSVREVEKSVPIAKRLNSKYVVVHPSGKLKDNIPREESLKRSLKSLLEIRETAKIFNVELLVENLPLGYLGSEEMELKYLVDNGFKICFDFGHSLLTFENPLKTVEKFKDYIKVLHLHSNDRKSDKHDFVKEDFVMYEDLIEKMPKDIFVVIETKEEKKDNVLEFLNGYRYKK
uniref:Sugar phosphate isomerase/epimerase n=1 Tax=candidate division WOR-3 bacterium TaxID=2052148 RepID=A0A7C3J5Y6_UNCW3